MILYQDMAHVQSIKTSVLRSTVKAANIKFISLCHLKSLHLYTGLFKFEIDHYLTNVALV